jgi:hypothetical protein
MNGIAKLFNGACIFLCVFTLPGFCCAADVAVNKSAVTRSDNVLADIIYELSDFRNFRKKISELDALARRACKKTEEIKDESGVLRKYVCDQKSGIKSVRIDARGNGGDHFIMTLTVNYKYQEFENVKDIMGRRLGKASLRIKDMVQWNYTSDKRLSEMGNPMISTVRWPEDNSASFDLGIEQGP